MIDDKDNRYSDEDSDELWDDDLSLDLDRSDEAGTPVVPPAPINEGEDSDDDDEQTGLAADETPDDARPRRKRLFKIDEEEEEGDDYFDNDSEPEPPRRPKPKQVRLDPEDPDYWMEEEPDFPAIIRRPKKIWKWWLGGVAVLVVAIIGLWIWFFHPYIDNAVKYGYIKSMERRGTLVKTFEGVLIPYRELGDKTPTYFEEIPFSVDGDSLAAHMKGMMLECIPVRLEYETYHTPLFWKGASTMVVVKADTADTDKILPPEYR